MAQNITIAGNQYPSVPSILIPKTGGGGNATFTDTSPTTASASDVAQGKIFFDSTGSQQTGTATGGGGTDFIVTLSYDSQSDMWLPDKTLAEIAAAYSAGKTIASYAYDENLGYAIDSSCNYDSEDGVLWYDVINGGNDGSANYTEYFFYYLDGNGVTFDGMSKEYETDGATAVPADVANGKIFFNANGMQTGTASGGGGASNVVTGTFKGTTTDTAMDITLNYTGSGYPIAVLIYPSEGTYNSSGSFYNLIQRYAYNTFLLVKSKINTAPTYADTSSTNQALALGRYKSSTSSATSYTNVGNSNTTAYNDANATSVNYSVVRIRSKTKMSVFIAGTSYGFAANIEYKYWVMYSS